MKLHGEQETEQRRLSLWQFCLGPEPREAPCFLRERAIPTKRLVRYEGERAIPTRGLVRWEGVTTTISLQVTGLAM